MWIVGIRAYYNFYSSVYTKNTNKCFYQYIFTPTRYSSSSWWLVIMNLYFLCCQISCFFFSSDNIYEVCCQTALSFTFLAVVKFSESLSFSSSFILKKYCLQALLHHSAVDPAIEVGMWQENLLLKVENLAGWDTLVYISSVVVVVIILSSWNGRLDILCRCWNTSIISKWGWVFMYSMKTHRKPNFFYRL